MVRKLIGRTGMSLFDKRAYRHEDEFPYDKKMSGGYPYDALIHIDEDEAIMPGLTGQEVFNTIAPNGRRTKWAKITKREGGDGSEVLIGRLGSVYYVLDPMTNEAITPAFQHVRSLSHESMTVYCPNYRGKDYVIRARETIDTVATDQPEWQGGKRYPRTANFLRAPVLSMTRKQTNGVVKAKASARAVDAVVGGDPFGLEKPTANAAARGDETMRTLLENLAEYARVNAAFRARFLDTTQQRLHLPQVTTPTVNARMNLMTTPEQTQLTVEAVSGASFSLVQQTGGEVLFVNQYGDALEPDDPAYVPIMQQVDVLLNEYFARLYQETTDLSPERIAELRRKMGWGGIAGWQAARTIRKSRNSGTHR